LDSLLQKSWSVIEMMSRKHYGNIMALKSAYEAVISKDVEKIYHLGDLG